MERQTLASKAAGWADTLSDEEVVRRVIEGDVALFELLMRRNNRRVYRAVRSLVRDEPEVEDIMQQAYISAYRHLQQFAGSAKFSTWLVRIAINEAHLKLRQKGRLMHLVDANSDVEEDHKMSSATEHATPEQLASHRELIGLVERVVDELPEIYRTVFMLRDVEGTDTSTAAHALGVGEDVVKQRLHRARALVQDRLATLAQADLGSVFEFLAPRCDRIVQGVMEVLVHEP